MEKPKVNGSSLEDAMVVDSDEDETAESAAPSVAEFELDEDETDPSEPYHKIIRCLDINCGTSIRHIALPHIPAYIQDSAPGAFPSILLSNLVVAAACNDGSIKLVTLPLLPPLPALDESTHIAKSRPALPLPIAQFRVNQRLEVNPADLAREAAVALTKTKSQPQHHINRAEHGALCLSQYHQLLEDFY